jgi:Na+-transporting NADH:ubiquinone oxidoreductase subunit NqrE
MERRENLSESILCLIDDIVKLLPEAKKKKIDDVNTVAIIGIWSAFITILIFIGTLFKHVPLEITLPDFLPLCTVICMVLGTWLYLRHRVLAEYKQEASRFEEFRQKFERQKEEFIESL